MPHSCNNISLVRLRPRAATGREEQYGGLILGARIAQEGEEGVEDLIVNLYPLIS